MNLTGVKKLIKSNKNINMTVKEDAIHNSQEICIESKKSSNKLKATIMEDKNLKISLENEIGTPIEEYDSPVIDSTDLVDKIKDAMNLYDMIDDLNIDFTEDEQTEQEDYDEEDIEVADEDLDIIDNIKDGVQNVVGGIKDTIGGIFGEETDAETGEEIPDEELIADFDNDGEDETLLNEEDEEIEINDTEDDIIDDEEISEAEELNTQSKLNLIQDRVTDLSKELSDVANNSEDTEMMSIIMDLANNLSSDALDIEDAIETINELDPDEDLEEVEECDKTEAMLLKFRNCITESKLLAKKIKNTNDVDKTIFEKYIKIVDEIL